MTREFTVVARRVDNHRTIAEYVHLRTRIEALRLVDIIKEHIVQGAEYVLNGPDGFKEVLT